MLHKGLFWNAKQCKPWRWIRLLLREQTNLGLCCLTEPVRLFGVNTVVMKIAILLSYLACWNTLHSERQNRIFPILSAMLAISNGYSVHIYNISNSFYLYILITIYSIIILHNILELANKIMIMHWSCADTTLKLFDPWEFFFRVFMSSADFFQD